MPETMETAIIRLRADPQTAKFIFDSYLDADLQEAAQRFLRSAEFRAVQKIISAVTLATILDVGAGNGIATFAFCQSGARLVYALEPDPSPIVGREAVRQLIQEMPVQLLDAFGESIPLPNASVDIVYARQVLHHTRDLKQVLRECARVLKPQGIFLACREHVVDTDKQRQTFLNNHPIHQITHAENAFLLDDYRRAITQAGLQLKAVWGPWDSVINAPPEIKDENALSHFPEHLFAKRFGKSNGWLGALPGLRQLVWAWLKRPEPGRLYTFWAVKP